MIFVDDVIPLSPGTVPGDLARLPFLQVLVLRNNDISGCIPGELGSLTGLKILELQVNKLQGKFIETADCFSFFKLLRANPGRPGNR